MISDTLVHKSSFFPVLIVLNQISFELFHTFSLVIPRIRYELFLSPLQCHVGAGSPVELFSSPFAGED